MDQSEKTEKVVKEQETSHDGPSTSVQLPASDAPQVVTNTTGHEENPPTEEINQTQRELNTATETPVKSTNLEEPPPVYTPNPQMNSAPRQQGAAQKVTPLHSLGLMPQRVDCPHCKKVTRTRIEQHGQGAQVAVGALLCLFCVCLACIPCITHMFEENYWYCTECNNQLAYQTGNGPISPRGAKTVPSQYAANTTTVQSQYAPNNMTTQSQYAANNTTTQSQYPANTTTAAATTTTETIPTTTTYPTTTTT